MLAFLAITASSYYLHVDASILRGMNISMAVIKTRTDKNLRESAD